MSTQLRFVITSYSIHYTKLYDLLSFDRVLLLEKEGDIKVGTPTVDGASIKAKVLGEVKGDKVIVFKKKRRKTYRKKNGHRQRYTQVLIEEIVA